MIKFSEYVSLGHPDKIADYISQYLLDQYIKHDPFTKYAVEVQIKDYQVTLGGEVSSSYEMNEDEIQKHVRDAVNEIGYTKLYQEKWGKENTICGDSLKVNANISQQSLDIAQGLVEGWGDQGIFFGMATQTPETGFMPYEHTLAKRLCKALFESGIGGLDIKTQVITYDDVVKKVIIAIPLLSDDAINDVKTIARNTIKGEYELVVNGTGRYVKHSTLADCGTTGRKLTVDFYGGNCLIGGGSPWTKDASKADLTLNLLARSLARQYSQQYKCNTFVSLSCCIGKNIVDVCVQDANENILKEGQIITSPSMLQKQYNLNKPIYSSMCRWGLFGEFQKDKAWETI